jgi:hypothetical protein
LVNYLALALTLDQDCRNQIASIGRKRKLSFGAIDLAEGVLTGVCAEWIFKCPEAAQK